MTRTSIVALALLHFLWQGALIHLTLALALRALAPHRANLRYSLGVAALLLMALAPIVTAGMLARPAATPLDETTPQLTQPVATPGGGALDNQRGSAARSRAPALATPLRNAAAALSPMSSPLQPAMPWLVAAWLTGVIMLAMRLLGGWMHLRSIVRSGWRPSTQVYDELLARLCARLRVSRPVRVLESAAVHAPAVIGWLRPVLLVPASMSSGLTIPQLEAILAHELAHVRRHDYAVNLLQTVIETVLFYHPAVWWVSRQVRREREHCCDDLAVATSGDARLFASALLDLEVSRSDGARLAMAATGGNLVERVRRLIVPATTYHGEESRWLAWVAVLLFLVLVGGGSQLLRAESGTPGLQPNVPATFTVGSAPVPSVQQPPDTVIFYRGAESLDARWLWASRTARENQFGGYWIGYVIQSDISRGWHYVDRHTPVSAGGGTMLSGHLRTTDATGLIFSGERLADLIPGPAPSDMAILIGFSARDGRAAIDRIHAGNFAFPVPLAGRPLLWLGESPDAPSLRVVTEQLDATRSLDQRRDLISIVGLHTSSALVRPVLQRFLESEDDEEMRADIVEALGYHADDQTLGLLARLARDHRMQRVRSEAAETVSEVELPAAFDTLIALTRSLRDIEALREAVEGLAQRPEPRALDVLQEIARRHPSTDVQREAVETIGELQNERSIATLSDLVRSHENSDVRREAVETLGEHAPLEEAVRLLRRIVEEDASVDVQREAVETLAELDDRRVHGLLLEIAEKHRELDVQREATESLGRFAEISDVRRALERLARTHPHEDVRHEAMQTLAEAVPQQQTTEFLRSIVRSEESRDMKIQALEALSEMKHRDALTIIIDAATAHPDREVRRRAIQLLGDSDDPRAQATLERLLTRP